MLLEEKGASLTACLLLLSCDHPSVAFAFVLQATSTGQALF